MSKKLSIILLEDIPSLGAVGDIVTASEGYARNFLFPLGKAALATAQTQAVAREKAQKETAAAEQALTAVQDQAAALEGTELTLKANLKEDEVEEIYGSITARDIAQALHKQTGLPLKAKDIMLPQPLTALGTYKVAVNLADAVEAQIVVTVVADAEAS